MQKSQLGIGIFALVMTVILWSSFALTIRWIDSSSLTPLDGALIRFGTPILLLAPWIPRAWRQLRSERLLIIVLLAAGGIPHFMLSTWGGALTSAATVGVLLPGTVPLFVALILWIWKRQKLPAGRCIALAIIILGVGVTVGLKTTAPMLAGIGILLAAGCAWAVYSIGLRESRLSLTSVILIICIPAVAAAGLAAGFQILPSHLLTGTAQWSDVLLFVGLQGIGTGVASMLAYATAVRALGSARAATWAAISPVLTSVVAIPLFGERFTATSITALVLVVGGVLAYNLLPARRDRLPHGGSLSSEGVTQEAAAAPSDSR